MSSPTTAAAARPLFTPDELRAPTPQQPLFALPRVVAFQDIDAAGIIFFARVLEYFHDAYMAMLAARGIDVPALMRAGTYGIPLAHAEADYLAPLRFGDRVRVELAEVRLGTHAFAVRHRVRTDDAAARVCAVGQTVHVTIDRVAFRPIALPDELRAALAPAPSV